MKDMQSIVSLLLRDLKVKLKPSTYQSRQAYLKQLLNLANQMKLSEPCQKLFDAFANDDHGSKERRSMHLQVLKQVDKIAGTYLLTPEGQFFNPPDLPSNGDANKALERMVFPISGSIDSGILISRTIEDLKAIRLSKSSIGQYLHALRYFQAFLIRKYGNIMYSPQGCQEFLEENDLKYRKGLIKEWRWKINRKATVVIMEVAITGHYYWKKISPFELVLNEGGLESIHKEYISSLNAENLSPSTISLRDYVFRSMISLGEISSKEAMFSLSYESVQCISKSFAEKCCISSLHTVLNIMINLLRWLWEHGYTQKDLSGCLLKPFVQRGRIVPYLDHENEEKVLEYLNGSFLRERAMALLALRLGMRSIDICNLRFDEIDWYGDRIRIHQHKTGEPLVLPLTSEVGNAIYDYIINERPSTSPPSPFVFLNRFAPYHKLGKMYPLCRRAIELSNASIVDGKHKGSHVFRQTMVHRLLEKNVPHQVITDTLGHTDKNSDKCYISMEAQMLRMCSLDLQDIGQKHWNGGTANV
ncbi:tyrosine-type recombinase/integrase [Butyrivibrio sp. INlla16]|uniref:tyrosine-type recombinase/integrase n=1 Tax=Butyrivibrio sp. INlla16 TaxID=1520807 RepID=UPI00087F31D6|nr:tyrosine-type recombinase/integrase [Butyrivibrio sp. INlla16]SDB54350.1 Site-specific recombinase XerD [Butyrivibrio sp. INlla16]